MLTNPVGSFHVLGTHCGISPTRTLSMPSGCRSREWIYEVALWAVDCRTRRKRMQRDAVGGNIYVRLAVQLNPVPICPKNSACRWEFASTSTGVTTRTPMATTDDWGCRGRGNSQAGGIVAAQLCCQRAIVNEPNPGHQSFHGVAKKLVHGVPSTATENLR